MSSQQLILQRLQQLEAVMREHNHWQAQSPAASALASTQPFCLDTLAPLEWLQWVLIPRMQALIAADAPLPQTFAVAHYYEMALPPATPGHPMLLLTLRQLDALFTEPSA